MKIEIFIVTDKKLGVDLLFNDVYEAYNYTLEDSNTRIFNVFSFGENYELQVCEFKESHDHRLSLKNRVA